MNPRLILSLFPGIGLLDQAFEEAGFSVVRGPDLLWGGDIERFHSPPGVFEGVIGGPPCQAFSTASAFGGANHKVDLIPEFMRVVSEASPSWVVMENVIGALHHPVIFDDWHSTILRDWDCGGHTNRRRVFWTWPFFMLAPTKRPGIPSRSVIASTAKQGGADSKYGQKRGFLEGNLPLAEYARLQGAESITARLEQLNASKRFIVHVLGNGVPLAMGRHVAAAAKQFSESM